MRRKYSTGLLVLLTTSALAAPCPPQLAQTARQVAVLRGVPGDLAPPCRWVGVGELRRELDAKLERDLPLSPPAFLEVLSRFGLIEGQPETLYQKLLDFYVAQVLGFYEPSDGSMVLVDSPAAAAATSQSVWAHELAHAAQQHRFRFPERLLALRDNGDVQRAASAVAEGDAMLVMFLLDDPSGGEGLGAVERMLASQAAATPVPPGLPEYFVAELVFPYTAGFSVVLRRYRERGWEGVDDLLERPPASTAALLHPDRPAPGPPVSDAELPTVPAGWDTVITDTVGEWALSFLLGRRLPEEQASRLAATWDGDRLRLARHRDHPQSWALAWKLRCREPRACGDLAAALERQLPTLFATLPPPGVRLELEVGLVGTTLDVRANWPDDGAPENRAARADGDPTGSRSP